MSVPRCRATQRRPAASREPRVGLPGSSLGKHAEILRDRPQDLSGEDLQEIGRQIAVSLRGGGTRGGIAATREDEPHGGGVDGGRFLRAVLEAAALFTATCSVRSVKEQEAVRGTQDKVLAGLRGLSSSLAPDLNPLLKAALLSLLAQPEFIKKREGSRQHLVQALVEAASGPVPLSALLPILRAKETGPLASSVALEVVERVAQGNIGGNASMEAVLELLHRVVAEVVTSGAKNRGKGSTRGPPTHLLAFLVQACSVIPEYVLAFSKDLLSVGESRIPSARKLSLVVLGTILDHAVGCQGTAGPALAELLRFARSDGDATVRCAAFDIVADYLVREDGPSDHCREEPTKYPGCDSPSDQDPEKPRSSTAPIRSSTETNVEDTTIPIEMKNAGGRSDTTGPSGEPPAPMGATTVGASRRHGGEKVAVNPWAVGGALLISLSASADAVLADGSKAVRAKALSCSIRILETHGGGLQSGRCGNDAIEAGKLPSDMKRTLSAVVKGAWSALEAVATESCGTSQASVGAAGAGRNRKTVDAARDLLNLPCMDPAPIDLLVCYERCCSVPGAGEGEGATAAKEVKRALQDVVSLRFCGDIDSLLSMVSVVMLAEDGGGVDGHTEGSFVNPELDGNLAIEGCSDRSLSEVLCELLAGVDGEVMKMLLRDTLEMYSRVDGGGEGGHAATAMPIVLRTVALLGEAHGNARIDDRVPRGTHDEHPGWGGCNDQASLLAGGQQYFWRRLEQRMEGIGHHGSIADRTSTALCGPSTSGGGGGGGGADATTGMNGEAVEGATTSWAISELAELLRIFRLLAVRSLLSPDIEMALETLVFPSALSRRRLIRPAVGLALALLEPHRVLLSSLAILQDAAFARSSTDVGRGCDYVRLIGVLTRENASFIAKHVREQYGSLRARTMPGVSREERGEKEGNDDYMAGASNREAMEVEIRRLCEASVTSDGMLSCYTPFLLAIVRCRAAADSATSERPTSGGTDVSPPNTLYGGNEGKDYGAASSASCPPQLCAEALWALSEYAVLSPRLAVGEVLPLAEGLARNTQECPQVRTVAARVLTRRELATDEIAARVCALLEDRDSLLRKEVLGRLGCLMKESRIKTAHLSHFALLLVDANEGVRRTAHKVFAEHLRSRPDSVCRCLFETYFTLDAEEATKRKVLEALILVSQRAVPGQGFESLGGALMRKSAENSDSDAAYFLSLIPPTATSLMAAEVALRGGQLGQCPPETVSLIATHFTKGIHRSQPATAQQSGRSARDTLSKKQALEMAARMKSLMGRRRGPRVASRVSSSTEAGNSSMSITRPRGRQTAKDVLFSRRDEESDGAEGTDPRDSSREVRRIGQRTPQVGSKASTSIVASTKRRRGRENPRRGGDSEANRDEKENANESQDEDNSGMGI